MNSKVLEFEYERISGETRKGFLQRLLREFATDIEAVGHENMKINWYDLDGKTNSFEILCINIGLEVEYEVIYRLISKDVNSSRAYSRLKMEEGKVSALFANTKGALNKSLYISFLINSVEMDLDH